MNNSICFHAMPLTEELRGGKKKHRLDRKSFARFLYNLCKCCSVVVCVEDIWGFGVQHKKQKSGGDNKEVKSGTTSMWNFSGDYGALTCVLEIVKELHQVLDVMDFQYFRVSPQRWQKKVGKSKGDGKDASVKRAYELYPDAQLVPPRCRVPSDGRAEALLMAHFAAMEAGMKPGVYVGIDPGLKGAICVLTLFAEAAA